MTEQELIDHTVKEVMSLVYSYFDSLTTLGCTDDERDVDLNALTSKISQLAKDALLRMHY